MSRGLAMFVVLAQAVKLAAQDQPIPAGKDPVVVQFDGKTLQDWQFDGESKIEDGTLLVGGKGRTKMRLTTPLGERFEIRLECQYQGGRPNLRVTSAHGLDVPLPGMPGPWGTLVLERSRGDFSFSYRLNYSFRHLDGSGSSGGWWPDVGTDISEFAIVVPEDSTMSIRRISLVTSPPSQAPAGPWIPVAALVALLLIVMGLGWFLNRRKRKASIKA